MSRCIHVYPFVAWNHGGIPFSGVCPYIFEVTVFCSSSIYIYIYIYIVYIYIVWEDISISGKTRRALAISGVGVMANKNNSHIRYGFYTDTS